MELRYPLLFFIGIIGILIFLFYPKKRKNGKYQNGIKVANTKYIKENPYFQKKVKQYQKVVFTLKCLCILSIFLSIFLISRPNKIDTKTSGEYNRDIVLCMDISSSVYELDQELVKNYQETVKSLKGERFSISIFNTTSVTLVPLTEDYEYVLDVLEKVDKGIHISLNLTNAIDTEGYSTTEALYYSNYIEEGTIENASERGSSIIGDGLASCVYNFSNLEEERTRIIIFSTDNEDASKKPITTLENAASLANKKGIKVFAIGTKGIQEKDEKELKSIIEKHGGTYYSENASSIKEIISNIEKTSKTLLDNKVETKKIDMPEIPFILLLFSTISLLLLRKKVLL